MKTTLYWLLGAGLLAAAPGHAQTAPSAPAIEIVDQREAGEDNQHTLSLAIWNCEYMVTRVSDKKMPVARLQQFQAEVSAGLTGLHAGETLIVKRYAVYMNEGAQMTASAIGAGVGGAIGGALAPKRLGPKCSRDKMSAGWFDPSEVTTKKPPIIAEVTVQFRGKDYSARAAYTPAVGTGYYPTKPQQLADRIALYTSVNRLIIEQIQHDIDGGPAGS